MAFWSWASWENALLLRKSRSAVSLDVSPRAGDRWDPNSHRMKLRSDVMQCKCLCHYSSHDLWLLHVGIEVKVHAVDLSQIADVC